jgi:hypothetical protein
MKVGKKGLLKEVTVAYISFPAAFTSSSNKETN